MDPSEELFKFVSRHIEIPETEMLYLKPFLEVRHFGKKGIVLNSGEVDKYFNYIVKGLVRKYVVHKNKEINFYFATEGDILNSAVSFLRRSPSDIMLETLEPTTIISISHDNLEFLYRTVPFFERVGRLVMANELLRKEEWEINRIKQTTRERFIGFVKDNPDLLQRVPQKMLASYLNIEPETFSRMKHLLMKKNK